MTTDKESLRIALEKMEAAWVDAESARIAALKAAESASAIAKSIRDNWKRSDGNAICDFSAQAREVANVARQRASAINETVIQDAAVKAGLRALKEGDV